MSDHLDIGLHRLEQAFRKQPPEKLALFADVLRKRRISEKEMGDAVVGCIETCKFFPSLREILNLARPQGINLPPREQHPVWDSPRETPMERARAARSKLAEIIDIYRKQNRTLSTISAVERDLAKLDREIAEREQLANETIQMSETEAAAYGVRFWGGEKHMPYVLALLDAGDHERNLRGPEQWDGSI